MPFKDKQAKVDYQRAYMRRRRAAAVRPKPEVLDPVMPVTPDVTPCEYVQSWCKATNPRPFTGPLTKQRQVKGFNK